MMITTSIAPDLRHAADIIASRGGRLGKPLHLLEETESTNDDAKRGARENAEHGATWLTETQSRGRGRQGRAWISPRGENLLFSVLMRIPCVPARVPPLALVCGLAVRDAVAKAIGDDGDNRVLVKWPNDVVVVRSRDGSNRMQKIAGVLVESAVSGSKVDYIIVGIGVNVHTRDFSGDLSSIASIATSVALENHTSTASVSRAEILADILHGLDRDIEHVAHRGLGLVHARLMAHDALAGRNVSDGAHALGVACGVDIDGRLLVRQSDGSIVKIASGEVHLTSGST